MYTEADDRAARRQVRLWQARLAAVLAPLLALYVLGIVRDCYGLMLGALLVAFICCMVVCDLALLPALRYRRFLKGLQAGLRRETHCRLCSMEDELQWQDGAQVRVLHVALETGEARIFYVNARKVEYLSEMNGWATLTSCGRHVLECRAE